MSGSELILHAIERGAAQGRVSFVPSELASECGMSRQAAAVYLRRLASRGDIEAVGRRYRAWVRGRAPRDVHMSVIQLQGEAAALAVEFGVHGVPALVSGFDVLSGFQNQLSEHPLLIVAERGSGDEAAALLARRGFSVLLNPGRAAWRGLRAASGNLAVIRERSLDDYSDLDAANGMRRIEDAWIDLVGEASKGYPASLGELAHILSMFQGFGVSWSRLHRGAARRGWPMSLDFAREVPLVVERSNSFWSELASELQDLW